MDRKLHRRARRDKSRHTPTILVGFSHDVPHWQKSATTSDTLELASRRFAGGVIQSLDEAAFSKEHGMLANRAANMTLIEKRARVLPTGTLI